MTTKKQEREVLKQIKTLVAELGSDSYIATAFDGAFDDAERNISDDAAYSYKARFEKLQADLSKAQADVKNAEDRYRVAASALDAANDECGALYVKINALRQKYNDLAATNIELEKTVGAAKNEVITLKAKLYDYMVAGA